MTISPEIINFLENLNGLHINLRFEKIIKQNENTLTILYHGRSLNGSYIYEEEQVNDYLQVLNNNVYNLKFKYVGGENVYSNGKYVFEVNFSKFKNKNFKGKILSASQYTAFAIEFGTSFALIHSIVNNIMNFKYNYDKVSVVIKNNNLYFDKTLIAKILKFNNPDTRHFQGHNTDCIRTFFDETYELMIEEKELLELYVKKMKEIYNFNCEIQNLNYFCEYIDIITPYGQSQTFFVNFSDSDFNNNFRIGDYFPKLISEKIKTNLDEMYPKFEIGDLLNYTQEDCKSIEITGYEVSKTEGVTYSYKFFSNKHKSSVWCSGGLKQLVLLKENEPRTNKDEDLIKKIDFNEVDFTYFKIREEEEFNLYNQRFDRKHEYEQRFQDRRFDRRREDEIEYFDIETINLNKNLSRHSNVIDDIKNKLVISHSGMTISELYDKNLLAKEFLKKQFLEFNQDIIKKTLKFKNTIKNLKLQQIKMEKLLAKTNDKNVLKNRLKTLKVDIDNDIKNIENEYLNKKKEIKFYRILQQKIRKSVSDLKNLLN